MVKKILVVSNNSFSFENSNGRTLAGFFRDWPIDKIAQFYTYSQTPNSGVCNNYFRVTDKQALFSLFKGSVNGNLNLKEKKIDDKAKPKTKNVKYRNPLVMILRNFIWNLGFWKGKYFNDWLNKFNPDIILVQAGDTAYRLKIATDLAKKRNIPLLIYNSEGYYFNDDNYFENAKKSKVFYSIFIKKFRKQLGKTINYASHTIYSCEPLKNDFDRVFKKPSSVIYTASDVQPTPYEYSDNKTLKLSYLGNLGLGRHETLIELANVIQNIDSDLVLDIYGKCPNENVLKAFRGCSSINYKGFVSYNEVKNAISQSDILFHVEHFSNSYIGKTKYGFSTKIADSLMSGKCFFLYAPSSIACTKYILKNNPDCVATNRDELKIKIKTLIENTDYRMHCSHLGLSIAKQNHSSDVVSRQFSDVINSLI